MFPAMQPLDPKVTSSSAITAQSTIVQDPSSEKIDLFAPKVILNTYLEYNSHRTMIGTNIALMWLLARNQNGAMRNALDTEDGRHLSENECKELVPMFQTGINQLLRENDQRTRRLVMSKENQALIKSPANTFKLIQAILGGEETFNQIPQFTLEKGVSGGWLSRYEESLEPYATSRYHSQSSSPTPVKAELVTAPLMRGTDRTNKPFFIIKAIDTENQKAYVQVFYQSAQNCAWYTEGEKIVVCNYLIDEYGTFDANGKAIPQLQQLLQTGEISKACIRRPFYSEADIEEHRKLGDLEEYLNHFDPSKYKWVLVQNK